MRKYIFKRCVIAIFTLLVLVTIIFILVRLLPGDPFASEKATTVSVARMREYYGLDKPLISQWATYIGNLLRGNLGVSYKYAGRSVNSAIAQAFPYSASLGVRALVLALVAGLYLGTVSAQKAGRAVDQFCVLVAIIGVSMPDFIVGSILQFVFALKLRVLPAGMWNGFSYKVLPVCALSLYTLALVTRLMRSSMLEVISQDYILTAKAKGLSSFEIIWRHQLRNAILPVITVLGPITAAILTGTFVIEKIYAIPGMGKFYVQSVYDLDYSMILGMTVFYGFFLVVANLLVDILYVIVDPRIKLVSDDEKRNAIS